MPEAVQITFEGDPEDPTPMVTIHNPKVLSPATLSQVQRYGLVGGTAQRPVLAGRLKGTRKSLTEMIQSYGHGVDVVPVP
jgi:hypothetical protein